MYAFLLGLWSRGLVPTDEELAENIKYARAAFDNGEYDPYNKDYAESMGEDIYWNEVYPAKARAMLSINKLRHHVEWRAVSYTSAKTPWIDFSEATLAKTTIILPESDHHSTSLENVMGFLADVRQVNRESLR